MKYIENKNEIKTHLALVDTFIDREKTEEFVYQNVFNEKFKYLLFVDEAEFSGYIFEGLELYLNDIHESDFFVNELTQERHIAPYSFEKNKSIPYQNMIEEYEASSPHACFGDLNNVSFEYLYYTKVGNWCGWIAPLWEIGVFAFETEALVKHFLEIFEALDKYAFYTPKEVIDKIWLTPKKEYKEAFLTNYSDLSYLKKSHKVLGVE